MINDVIGFDEPSFENVSNELQIIKFIIDGNVYGINLIKIKEIIISCDVHKMPSCPKNVEGIFKSREDIITVIDLPEYLGLNKSPKGNKDIFLITNFSNANVAFRVHSIVGIKSLYWHDLKNVEVEDSLLIGVYSKDQEIINILDFEKILFHILPSYGIKLNDYEVTESNKKSEKIVIAEDSYVLSSSIKNVLTKCGYENLCMFKDGQDAWDYLCKEKNADTQDVFCVITDIEMSKMDGHKLIHLIRNDDKYKSLPVIIFSSLISDSVYQVGESLNVYAQITKPEIDKIIFLLDELRNKNK